MRNILLAMPTCERIPTPTIDTAVAMRNLSGREDVRAAISKKYGRRIQPNKGKREEVIQQARRGLYAAIILTYAQGFAQLAAASQAYG